MSIEVYPPGKPIPYTEDQLAPLCQPEKIDPQDFLDESWLDSRYGLFYVDGGAPIGVAFCSVSGGGDDIERHMHVHVLCVSEAARGKGVGSKLLKEVDALTRKQGLNSIRLSAISTQLSFYKNHGFEPSGGDDDGYVAMKKTLTVGARRGKTRRPRRRPRKTLRGRSQRRLVLH